MTDAEKQALKDEILRERGYWARFHDVLLERSPEFLKAYIAFQAAPSRSGILPRKLCEFVYVAIDISVNHMYDRGGRRHMGHALDHGATADELLQVVLLTAVVSGRQPIDTGLDILADELGTPEADIRGSVPVLQQGYEAYGNAVWDDGPLSRKDKELIALAICAAPTCLFERGMRRHVRGALDAGASPQEIAAILHLSAAISVHTCTIGIPGLDDVLNNVRVESN
ncbi:carboxymuconolactone decarboxylase family protein [Microbaculum marinum]|uniref:Carboxymuconolactone decarboxylase family protein n=1 Tax=Microbaculum marinum TaxID=1764581 RepID=A0AAW9RVN3_9HYPH